MLPQDRILSQADEKAIAILSDFLPDKIFDMHMHYRLPSFNPSAFKPRACSTVVGDAVTMDTYIRDHGRFYPNKENIRGNLIIVPDKAMLNDPKTMRQAAVDSLVCELDKHPGCVGEVPVLAQDTREDIESLLVHPRIRGLKCYHLTAGKDNTWQCTIGEYLPEAAWEIANERGLCITLHMVRDLALADEENRNYICKKAAQYPNARLILAHAARGFAAWTAVESVEQVANYPNIYFDFSAICDPVPIMAIIQACGHKRVFWGSDYPVSMLRGTCVSIGADFLWLYRKQLESCGSNTKFEPYLIGLQNLMAMRTACKLLKLSKQEIEDIFYNNAVAFFHLT